MVFKTPRRGEDRSESGVLTMVTMKSIARSRLNLEHDIRCAETELNIKQIV